MDRRGEDEFLVDPQYVTNRKTFDVIHVAGDVPIAWHATEYGIENADSDPVAGA